MHAHVFLQVSEKKAEGQKYFPEQKGSKKSFEANRQKKLTPNFTLIMKQIESF